MLSSTARQVLVFSLTILILSCLQDSISVYGLTCLQCDDILQPRHCHRVFRCNADEGCFTTLSLVTQQYHVGCRKKTLCGAVHTNSDMLCNECCFTDLCNSRGCGQPGYPAVRGPICYTCGFSDDKRPCTTIDVCSIDEECNVVQRDEFGDHLLTSACELRHICQSSSTKLPTVIGRSVQKSRTSSQIVCNRCCSDDLCNRECCKARDDTSPNSATPEKQVDFCFSSPCQHGTCASTLIGYTCTCELGWTGTNCDASSFNCLDILEKGIGTTDGVYAVNPNQTGEIIQVYCDMTSDGGGWTVFQKRFNGTVDFYRNFTEYENGFGSVYGEYWLGLKYIYLMTTGGSNELRLDLGRASGQTAYEVYKNFYLSSSPTYTLNIGSNSGTAGDSGQGLTYHNGRSFTAFDMDQDGGGNCAVMDHGGWWYFNCAYVNLNGEYATPGTKSNYDYGEGGVTYRQWSSYESLKTTEMKFRRR